jgi:hypothetical protein
MKLTESQARKMGMTKNAAGDWVTKEAVEFIESQRGGSNAGMAAARGFLRGCGRTKSSPEQVRTDTISSAVAIGMSEAEATAFYEIGRRGR